MSKIIYTAQPIKGGIVEKRVAKEKLRAIVEEILIKEGLVESYSITDNKQFSFPFTMPNIMNLNDFFGKKIDYNLVVKEVSELFEQPKKELAQFEADLEKELEKANDEQILSMVERFHYTSSGTKERYIEALETIKKLWKPYEKISSIFKSIDFNGIRKDLSNALATLDDCHVLSLMKHLKETQGLLQEGKRKEAKEEVRHRYSDWSRKNIARLYNVCGDEIFYGEGFWMARLVAPEKIGEKNDPQARTIEFVLNRLEKPFQIVSAE